jgi:thymidylate kinase
MIKRIIIEGADQQGKSTLCNLLHKELGWDIKYFGKPFDGFNFVEDYMLNNYTISDRNFLSEVVYSKIRGEKSRAQATLLCNIFKQSGTLLVLLDRGDDYVFDDSRHEDFTQHDIHKAIKIYREEFPKLDMEKMVLNPNCQDFSIHVQSIIDLANGSI